MTASPWASAHFAAEVALLRHLATSPFADAGTGPVSWVTTLVASNTHNGVTRTRLDESSAAAEIDATIERFRARELPSTWFLDPRDLPTDLPRRLEAAGCRPERSGWVMGAHLRDLPRDHSVLPAGVLVTEVTGLNQLDDWFAAARGVTFDDDGASDRSRRRLYASLGLGPTRPWRHWLATDEGRPIGTASALFDGVAVALDNVGVVAPYRRRGIGSALTLAAIGAARSVGSGLCVLGPSPDGQPLYASLGFELAPALSDRAFYLPMA